MRFWVARDDDQSCLNLFSGEKPTRDKSGIWLADVKTDGFISLPTDHPDFMDLTWDNEPVEVFLSKG